MTTSSPKLSYLVESPCERGRAVPSVIGSANLRIDYHSRRCQCRVVGCHRYVCTYRSLLLSNVEMTEVLPSRLAS